MVRRRQGDDVGFPVVVDDAVVIVIVVVVEEVVDFQETLPLNLHQLRSGRLDILLLQFGEAFSVGEQGNALDLLRMRSLKLLRSMFLLLMRIQPLAECSPFENDASGRRGRRSRGRCRWR